MVATQTRSAQDDLPPDEIDHSVTYELCLDGMWRAYDAHGVIATASTWRAVYERAGNRWN